MDLLELLETIISPSQLEQALSPDANLPAFRANIQLMGIRLQKEANERRNQVITDDESNDLGKIMNRNLLEPFLD